jgi:hypothetical protein
MKNNYKNSLNDSAELDLIYFSNNNVSKFNCEEKGIQLDIALSSHSHCLLCKKKSALLQVKAESILFA